MCEVIGYVGGYAISGWNACVLIRTCQHGLRGVGLKLDEEHLLRVQSSHVGNGTLQ